MTSIITGDIVNCRKLLSYIWIDGLKKLFKTKGKNPSEWEIYRGDKFQLEIKNVEKALIVAL